MDRVFKTNVYKTETYTNWGRKNATYGSRGKENINTKSVILNSVAPAQQTVEQAKSELKREDLNPTIAGKTVHKTNSSSKRNIKKNSRLASYRKALLKNLQKS
jgi:hypothetical protein